MKVKLLFVSLAALAVQALALAQGGPPQGGPGGFPGGPGGMMGGPGGRGNNEISLLSRQDVQDDLALTADQKTKVQALIKKYQPQRGQGGPGGGGPGGGGPGGGQGGPPGGFQGGQGGPPGGGPGGDFDPEKMREQMEKRQAEQKKAIAAVLSESQVKRLDEIKVQMMGNSAVNDPEVSKKLEITQDQKDRIQVMIEDERENMPRPDFNSGERPDPKQMQEQMKKMQDKINAGIEAILTSSQKAKLKELGGKAFKRVDPQPGQRPAGGGGLN